MIMGRYLFAILMIMVTSTGMSATARSASRDGVTARSATATPTAAYNYNYMYPYLNNQMRVDLNPGVTPGQSANPINAIVRTEQLSAPRRVVSRPTAATTSRSATKSQSFAARAAAPTSAAGNRNTVASGARAATNTSQRRVVARSATNGGGRIMTSRSARGDASYISNTTANAAARNATTTSVTNIPATRCMADYIECMNGYCARENTTYNRCYCSARLAQIDATYQPAIDNLIKQILRLQSSNAYSDAEMNAYWDATISKYTGDNSWIKLDDALNINWAGTESRVRGQQAFATGHEYCAQHLRGCAYMATNMRDAYRSEIARDCATYENGLNRLKTVAESIVGAYSE